MALKNVTFDDDDWLYKVSVHHPGKSKDYDIWRTYNAYPYGTHPGTIYKDIMGMSADKLANSGYALRVAGANEAYDGFMEGFDYSEGAYFWNGSKPQTGFNWDMVHNGTYTITTTLGNTTFMRYTDESRNPWP